MTKDLLQSQIDADQYKSDQDILNEILDQYQEYEEALEDVMEGIINPLIVRGPPGIGKSESVKRSSQKAKIKSKDWIGSTWDQPVIEENDNRGQYPYELTKELTIDGALVRGADYSVWALVADLFANKSEGMLCIDDNDEILKDSKAMAILMKACEQETWRDVSYTKANSTHELQLMGVESSFKVRTPIIILSNIDFDLHIKSAQATEMRTGRPMHGYLKRWEALMQSRGKYIDLQMNSPRRVRIYCENLIENTKMLEKSNFLKEMFGRSLTSKESQEAIDWVRQNQKHLKNRLDLRTYNKVATKILKRKKTWEQSARLDLLRVV
jgi:hypothetical protein